MRMVKARDKADRDYGELQAGPPPLLLCVCSHLRACIAQAKHPEAKPNVTKVSRSLRVCRMIRASRWRQIAPCFSERERAVRLLRAHCGSASPV